MSNVTHGADQLATAFAERVVQIDETWIRYLEAGQGDPLIVLDGSGALRRSQLYSLLAQQYRVIAFDISPADASLRNEPTANRDLAHTLTRAASATGLEHYALIGTSAAAPVALWQALDAPEQADAVVLISPSALSLEGPTTASRVDSDSGLEGRLGEVKAATLVLCGTEDRTIPPETGRTYAQRIPKCYYVLVYDAGHALVEERPYALCAIVTDFLERRETFVVNRSSTTLNP